jgi:hypothetical protein
VADADRACGEGPTGVIRDAKENGPWIDLNGEAETLKAFDSKYEGLLERLEQVDATAANNLGHVIRAAAPDV